MLHLGNGCMVPKAHIAFILDYQECLNNQSSAACLDHLSRQAENVFIAPGDVKSLIYSINQDQQILYYSPISAATLLKRSKAVFRYAQISDAALDEVTAFCLNINDNDETEDKKHEQSI